MTDSLPPGWELRRLDEVADVRLGRQRSPGNHQGPQMRPYLRAANVGWAGLLLDDVKQMNFSDTEMSVYRLEPNDILLSEASGSADEVGKPALWSGQIGDCAFQNTLLRVRSRGPAPKYLLYFFKHLALSRAFARRSRGVGIHHIGRAALASWPVPLPTLTQQERIVEALEDHLSRLDVAESNLARVVAKSALARGAVFQAAVTPGDRAEPGDVDSLLEERARRFPPGNKRGRPTPVSAAEVEVPWQGRWPTVSLEEATDPLRTISYGILKPGPNIRNGIPYVRVLNMRDDQLALEDLRYTSREIAAEYSRATLRPEDVLVSIRGTYGRVVLVPAELDGANITQDTARLAVLPQLLPSFVALVLRSPWAQSYMRRVARGVGVKGVNISDLRRLPIPLPSLPDQVRLTDWAEALTSDVDAAKRSAGEGLRRAGVLRRAVLAAAFSGGLDLGPHAPQARSA